MEHSSLRAWHWPSNVDQEKIRMTQTLRRLDPGQELDPNESLAMDQALLVELE